MQPNQPDVGGDVLTPSVIQLARQAFFRDDLAACMDILEDTRALPASEQREATLLRARVLIRTDRFADAVVLLGPSLDDFSTVDEACTARMLHGAAVSRTPGNLDRGQALLEAVSVAARNLGAHPAIQAEIAYMLAFVHWMKRAYSAVLHYAVEAERARADVISVRAAMLRGYVAIAKERYPEALALFKSAREKYDKCKERDQNLLERISVQIASLEVTFRSATISGTHARTDPGEVVADRTPGVLRMQIAAMNAWLHAFDDDERPNAYRQARIAEDLAPNPAWRMWALGNRALLTAAFGDLYGAAEFAAAALEIVDRIDWNETVDEQRIGLLFLTEVLTLTDPLSAVRVFDRYDALTSKIDRAHLFHDDIRLWIRESFVRGLVQRIRGEPTDAWETFQRVYTEARRIGFLWRAALALIELEATPSPISERPEHYLEAAAGLIREHFPRSFVARRLGRWSALFADPIATQLAPRPREVIRQVLSGKNPKQIAAAMGLSEVTVKGYLKTLFRAFGVHSTPELLVTCFQRGIGDPERWRLLGESAVYGRSAQRSGSIIRS
jgi:DNA-binding CsgD family transcriptional regulator